MTCGELTQEVVDVHKLKTEEEIGYAVEYVGFEIKFLNVFSNDNSNKNKNSNNNNRNLLLIMCN